MLHPFGREPQLSPDLLAGLRTSSFAATEVDNYLLVRSAVPTEPFIVGRNLSSYNPAVRAGIEPFFTAREQEVPDETSEMLCLTDLTAEMLVRRERLLTEVRQTIIHRDGEVALNRNAFEHLAQAVASQRGTNIRKALLAAEVVDRQWVSEDLATPLGPGYVGPRSTTNMRLPTYVWH